MHALPSPASESRQLCPRLPAHLVLPAQPLPQREDATERRRGGMANHCWGRAGNTGFSSSHPKGTVDNHKGTTQEQLPSICSPSMTLHRLPGED